MAGRVLLAAMVGTVVVEQKVKEALEAWLEKAVKVDPRAPRVLKLAVEMVQVETSGRVETAAALAIDWTVVESPAGCSWWNIRHHLVSCRHRTVRSCPTHYHHTASSPGRPCR